jgi:methionyl aminopeptidase
MTVRKKEADGRAVSQTNGEAEKADKPEDDESGDEEETPATGANGTAAAKKKKKKPKKKKTGGGAAKQTSPPTIPVSKFYPSGTYPLGEIREYTGDE